LPAKLTRRRLKVATPSHAANTLARTRTAGRTPPRRLWAVGY